jgi:hypothetical protein
MGIGDGDWGLGIGDWGLGPIPNPQSPIPNPQSPYLSSSIILKIKLYKIHLIINLIKLNKNVKRQRRR